MSLWTPDGERQVDPAAPQEAAENLTPEQEEQAAAMAKQLTEARAQILEADVADVIGNHALGIYELAAIHLTAEEPNLDQAKVAIDGLSALVEGLEGKLGQAEATLKEALHQIKLGFVQKSQEAEAKAKAGAEEA